MKDYCLEDEVWDEAWGNSKEGNKLEQVKDKDNRLFVYVHWNNQHQQDFLAEAKENNCFAQPIDFTVLQAGRDHITNKVYHQGKEITDLEEMKRLWNGTRPYFSISNANPDYIGNYCNWTYLNSIIETGWKRQFSSWA